MISDLQQFSSVLEAKTSVIKALTEISQKELSGQLTIRSLKSAVPRNRIPGLAADRLPRSKEKGWRVYFGRGKIHYATSLIANQERINYLISKFFPDINHPINQSLTDEYSELCSLWRSGKISIQQLRDVIYTFTQEALIHCLAFPPAKLELETTVGLDPILISAPIKEIAYPIRPQVLEWIKLRETIPSPLMRVGIKNLNEFYSAIAEHSAFSHLRSLAEPLTSFPNLYQLAQERHLNLLTLAQQLQLYIQEKQVQVKPYQAPHHPENQPVIACIDDSHAVQRNVKRTLEAAGYEVISLTEPAKALTLLARKKPDLILMDITMPEMNGYDLSKILRKSASLAEVPIVMLTGRDGVVDRLRSRMVGASDYITKPFNPHQLIQLVQQLTQNHSRSLDFIAK